MKSSSNLMTVRQFCEKHPAFSPAGLRHLIFQAHHGKQPYVGLIEAGAILKAGRKVLLHEDRFFTWLDKQNQVN